NQVRVDVDLTGLTPGEHGFHVHEKGDCSAADATSAGGHFNPTGAPHGSPAAATHHAGDLGNVTANANGEVHTSMTTSSITVTDGPRSITGRAVVVHADPDDFVSQPSGNAGPRVGCGVIVPGPPAS
ncbi:MAG: superoxide dismutase family protein, partial [Thermoanaerobaculia bacterium]